MKTILVDAIHAFVIKGEGIFKEMHDLLETFENQKILLTGANDDETKTRLLSPDFAIAFALFHTTIWDHVVGVVRFFAARASIS